MVLSWWDAEGVQAHKGLVHHQQPRLVQQRAENGQLLLHAVGVGRDRLAQIPGQGEELGIALDAALALVLGDAEDVGDEIQILEAGEKFIEIGIVGNIGDAALALQGVLPNGNAVHPDLAAVKGQNAAAGLSVVVLPAPLWPIKP